MSLSDEILDQCKTPEQLQALEKAKSPPGLYKTVLVLWTAYPADSISLTHLGHEVSVGGALCSKREHSFVADPSQDPDR